VVDWAHYPPENSNAKGSLTKIFAAQKKKKRRSSAGDRNVVRMLHYKKRFSLCQFSLAPPDWHVL